MFYILVGIVATNCHLLLFLLMNNLLEILNKVNFYGCVTGGSSSPFRPFLFLNEWYFKLKVDMRVKKFNH